MSGYQDYELSPTNLRSTRVDPSIRPLNLFQSQWRKRTNTVSLVRLLLDVCPFFEFIFKLSRSLAEGNDPRFCETLPKSRKVLDSTVLGKPACIRASMLLSTFALSS